MATTDLLDEVEARQYLGIGMTDESKSALVTAYVTACSSRIVAAVGPIVYGTLTETHDGGGSVVFLESFPLHSVTQVVEYDGLTAGTLTAETNAAKPAAGYVANLKVGKITRRDTNSTTLFPRGVGNVSVTFVAGRCASTAAVPERYKMACGVMLQHLWRSQQSSNAVLGEYDVPQNNFPRFSVPNAVKELLADEWHSGSGFAG